MNARRHITRFAREEGGAALVEMGIIMPLFLLLAFGLIDFGRLGFAYVMAQKATEQAVRAAVVRSPACQGVPSATTRSLGWALVPYGTACKAGDGLCADPGSVACTANEADTTGSDIYARINALLPTNATPANLRFAYDYDGDLGFVGGPYTPRVTVEIVDLSFEFVTPIGALATLLGANEDGEVGAAIAFPSMSASLPAEILMDGDPS